MGSPFTVEYIKDGNYVRVRVHAPVTRELADEFAVEVEKEVERTSCCGSLVDVRGFPNESSVHDNYEYSTWDMKETGGQPMMKRAVLTDADDDTHDLPILGMREAGFNVRKFTDEQEAIAWLTDSA